MISTPTTWATILGGAETTNQWGDPIEGTEEIATRVPCALYEQLRQSTSDEGQREPVTITFVTGYIPPRYNVTGANRLRDDRTGTVYLIDNVTRPQHAATQQDTRLDLRRVS